MAFNHNFTRHFRIILFQYIFASRTYRSSRFTSQISKALLILFGYCLNNQRLIGELKEQLFLLMEYFSEKNGIRLYWRDSFLLRKICIFIGRDKNDAEKNCGEV